MNCFCQYSYGHELNRETDSESSTQEKYEVSHKDWIWQGTEKDVDCSSYAALDNTHATRCVSSGLLDDHEGAGAMKRMRATNKQTNKPQPVPSYQQAQGAYKTVKLTVTCTALARLMNTAFSTWN